MHTYTRARTHPHTDIHPVLFRSISHPISASHIYHTYHNTPFKVHMLYINPLKLVGMRQADSQAGQADGTGRAANGPAPRRFPPASSQDPARISSDIIWHLLAWHCVPNGRIYPGLPKAPKSACSLLHSDISLRQHLPLAATSHPASPALLHPESSVPPLSQPFLFPPRL